MQKNALESLSVSLPLGWKNPSTRRSRLAWAWGCVVVTTLVTGCQNVKPWQRGNLADITMRPDRDPIGKTFNEHIWFSREAATGGTGVGGGGCGCN